MLHSFKKFMDISRREKMLFFESLLCQLVTGLLLKVIAFKRIPRLFVGPQQAVSGQQSSMILVQIKAATQRASRISPWRNKCLVQSLAARLMLSRRKIKSQLSLGVSTGGDRKMIAHAWLKAGDFEVVEKRGDYLELYLF
ncbi:MAG: lasso peptide biosynthesis B2 protein [Candidatus Atribacteria bacterium]|nr:MAG: lasso peptide biosynthesis B2 protein [Candidatus Atribacteria bacterium]